MSSPDPNDLSTNELEHYAVEKFKSSQHSHKSDEKYEDWIRIPPPPEDDRSTEALPTSAKDDARLWTLASWCIPALWLLVLFLAWVFA